MVVRAASPARATVYAPGLTVLAVLAVFATIYFARSFLLPITFALLLAFILSPVIRALGRLHIPAPLGAALILLSFVGALSFGGYELAGPVQELVTHAPETLRKAGMRLRVFERPVDQVTRAASQLERATDVNGSLRTPQVVLQSPSLASRFLGGTQAFAGGAIEVLLLVYFLLAAGNLGLEKVAKLFAPRGAKVDPAAITREIESSVSTYLFTTAAINFCEGGVVALAMWALGMPTPLVWGAMIAFLEFIPYIGMTVGVVVLTIAGLTTFSSLPHALAVPGAYALINAIQGNLVYPLVMSHRMTLNPVALFVGLAFWWWVWGIPGALLAVPIIATFKIISDHVDSLAGIGEFLGAREPTPRTAAALARTTASMRVPTAPLAQP